MSRVFIFTKLFFALILLFVSCPLLRAAQEVPSERIIERKAFRPTAAEEGEKKGEWSVGTFYEFSNIVQGSRYGYWDELTNYAGYTYRDMRGYVSMTKLRRFNQNDYTANFGVNLKLKDYYIHEEYGFGWDVNYIYKQQNILEVSHKLYRNLFWQMGYNYRHYPVNDTYLSYPGLIYYFGDNYIGVDYGISAIESRGVAQFGTIKSDFALTKFLHWSLGTAIGERLYDIFGLKASKEYGYIIFTAANLNISKNVNCRIGFSYGTERPKFIKRSLDASLSVKF